MNLPAKREIMGGCKQMFVVRGGEYGLCA
jgi:hypothetical protein